MTEQEAIKKLNDAYSDDIFRHGEYEACRMAIKALKEIQQYRAIGTVEELQHKNEANNSNKEWTKKVEQRIFEALEELQKYNEIGTVEELQKSVKEEDILKFYYIESLDKYVVGQRVDNLYYAEVGKTGLAFYMSRYLPWGEHVVDDTTAWKEYTYPSEPKEIPFFDWLQGFIKKECGGTIDECRAAVEKQNTMYWDAKHDECICPRCATHNPTWNMRAKTVEHDKVYCWHCGQSVEF